MVKHKCHLGHITVVLGLSLDLVNETEYCYDGPLQKPNGQRGYKSDLRTVRSF